MNLDVKEAFDEACRLLGEALVMQSFLLRRVAELERRVEAGTDDD